MCPFPPANGVLMKPMRCTSYSWHRVVAPQKQRLSFTPVRDIDFLTSSPGCVRATGGEKSSIPLAIMTSDDTDARTKALLESAAYFGMKKEQVILLKQVPLPFRPLQRGLVTIGSPRILEHGPPKRNLCHLLIPFFPGVPLL